MGTGKGVLTAAVSDKTATKSAIPGQPISMHSHTTVSRHCVVLSLVSFSRQRFIIFVVSCSHCSNTNISIAAS